MYNDTSTLKITFATRANGNSRFSTCFDSRLLFNVPVIIRDPSSSNRGTPNMTNRFDEFRQLFEKNHHTENGNQFSFKAAIADELRSKSNLIQEVRSLRDSEDDLFELGIKVHRKINNHFGSIGMGPGRKIYRLKQNYPNYYNDMFAMIGKVLRSDDNEIQIFGSTHQEIMEFHYKTKDETRLRSTLFHLLMVTLACKEGSKTIFGMVKFFERLTEFFLDQKLFHFTDNNIQNSFVRLTNLITDLQTKMKNDWEWQVDSRLEVQSALWMEFHSPKPK